MKDDLPGQATVLVVDDDARNRRLVRSYLEATYRVLEAENASQAFSVLDAETVDLVLLDVMMPGTSGLEACRQIRVRHTEGILPVLLLTALSEQEDRNAGLAAGADDFLSKPVDRRELLLRVAAFVRIRRQDQTIRAQLDELRSLDLLKDELAELIVHDLRNPLSGLLGLLLVLKAEVPDGPARGDLEAAIRSSEKLRDTLDDMLAVRKLESDGVVPDLADESLATLVRDAMTSVEAIGAERGVSIQLVSSGEAKAKIDRKLVRRALENLLANAVRYSRENHPIDVSVREVDRGVEIEIADRGPGVPEPMRRGFFHKFGGLEARKGRGRRGFGLGLYLVELVMSLHRGEVKIADREGGGSVFRLFLPEAEP